MFYKDKKIDMKDFAASSMVAAIYVVLTVGLAPISYGAFQFRISEVLNLLVFFNPLYAPGLIIGCLISNLFSPLGIIDVVFGTLATVFSVVCISRTKNLFIASLWPTVSCILIGAEIAYLEGLTFIPFVTVTLSVMFGEFVVVTGLGVPLFKLLSANEGLCGILRFKRTTNNNKLIF